jgi:hypothetical protein
MACGLARLNIYGRSTRFSHTHPVLSQGPSGGAPDVTAALHWRPANVHQCSFAQDVGIALTGFCKVDELRGDGLFDAIVTVSNPQRDANDLERNTQ